jgi:hypothetical protein
VGLVRNLFRPSYGTAERLRADVPEKRNCLVEVDVSRKRAANATDPARAGFRAGGVHPGTRFPTRTAARCRDDPPLN